MAKKSKPEPAPSAKDLKAKKKLAKNEPETEAAAPKPQRGLAIGDNFGWTGKLPATLLIEHCQKQKWNKVGFEMRKTPKGFVGGVDLSWKNPKTNTDIHIRWWPEPEVLGPRPTSNEARHFAATYAMYRLNHVKNLKMVLPVIFRDFWADMEARRQSLFKADRVAHDRYYNANPFQVHLDKVAAMEKKEKERQVRENSQMKLRKPTVSVEVVGGATSKAAAKAGGSAVASQAATKGNGSAVASQAATKGSGSAVASQAATKGSGSAAASQATAKGNGTAGSASIGAKTGPKKGTGSQGRQMVQFPFSKKAWAAAPFVDFPSELRDSISDSIQHHISWVEHDSSPDPAHTASWTEQLTALGFRASHVAEALSHTATFMDALEWLLFHVPEDDLPVYFAKRDEDTSVSLKISKDIQTEYLLQRLMLSGVGRKTAWHTYGLCGKDELRTTVALTHAAIGEAPHMEPASPCAESLDTWRMELEGISAVGTNPVELSHAGLVASVGLNVVGVASPLVAKLVYTPRYPHVMPGVQLVVTDPSFKLAGYIKKAVLRHLHAYMQEHHLYGECLVYAIIEWLEGNVLRVIENPGPLVPAGGRARDALSGAHPEAASTAAGARTQTPAKRSSPAAAKRAYEQRLQSPEWHERMAQRKELPAYKLQRRLVEVITGNQVTLVTGETGSGKSTQIVQFILDHMCQSGDFTSSIICTQPRRISTIGLAERISAERVQDVGAEVGYIIRGEKKTSAATRLSFVTTGVLLRMLQGAMHEGGSGRTPHGPLAGVSHVFIDEVHERSVDSDFLLIILKRLLKTHPHLKVVLMSATINTDVFMSYFDTKVHHVHIEGRTFPIADVYLEHTLHDLDYSMETADGVHKPQATSHFFKTGQLNYDLLAQTCVMIDARLAQQRNHGSILVFLPGIMEISRCVRHVEAAFAAAARKCWCLPLHSALSSRDQTRVFQSGPRGARKIVVSTNIAETSITIPDCVVVVDCGRQKSMVFDSAANQSRLVEDWCSQAEMAQRRGRAGRIQAGTCYHMYTAETQAGAAAQPVPEIKRTKLEKLYLVVKSMGVDRVQEFLASGLDPPHEHSLAKARSMLMEMGAVAASAPDPSVDTLTHLGKYLSYLPTDLHAGKLLVLGCIFGCVDMCLTLSAISSSGGPFLNSFELKDQVLAAKRRFGGSHGDLVASALAFHEWEQLPQAERRPFMAKNHLAYMALQDIQSTRTQFLGLLKELGFVPLEYRSGVSATHGDLNRNSANYTVVRALLTGSFTPQLARVQLPDTKYTKSLAGAVEVDSDARQTKVWIRNERYIGELGRAAPGHHFAELPATRAFVHPSSLMFSEAPAVSAGAGADAIRGADVGSGADVGTGAEEFGAGADAGTGAAGTGAAGTAKRTVDLTPSAKFSSANAIHKSPFLVYNSANYTSKLFLRDVTPTSTIAALLFGGDISYDVSGHVTAGTRCPGLVLDRWMPIRTWCKNGVLLKRLRLLLDQVIENKLSHTAGADDDAILQIIARVLRSEKSPV